MGMMRGEARKIIERAIDAGGADEVLTDPNPDVEALQAIGRAFWYDPPKTREERALETAVTDVLQELRRPRAARRSR